MKRIFAALTILCLFMAAGAWGATGEVKKVLPHFLDLKGQHAVSPSLYDRDAYQAFLRLHPDQQSGVRFDVNYKTKGAVWNPLKIRVELRGTAEAKAPKTTTLEKEVKKKSGWAGLELSGAEFREFGKVTSWRVTLWEGENLLSEQKSFLW